MTRGDGLWEVLDTATGDAAQEAERLTAAAVEVFAEGGRAAVSIERVAKRARLSESAFQRHFQAPEECLVAAYAIGCEDLVTRMEEVLVEGEPGPDRLVALIERGVDALSQRPDFARLLVEIASLGRSAREHHDSFRKRLIEMHRRARGPTDAPDVQFELLVGAQHQRLAEVVARGRPYRVEGLRAEAADAVWMIDGPPRRRIIGGR